MAPDFEDGWGLLIDWTRQPRDGDPVCVFIRGRGSLFGYCSPKADHVELDKANPAYSTVMLGDPETWRLIGVAARIVDRPVKPRPRTPAPRLVRS